MSWTFIPHSPTAGAWAARPFKQPYSLKQTIQQLRERAPKCEGQLVFTSDDLPKAMKEKSMRAEEKFYVSYNYIAQLEEFMVMLEWNQKKNLHKIVMYQHGYFIQ